MKALAKNTVYVIEVSVGSDSFNTYARVTNAFKITNAKRVYFDISKQRTDLYTSESQIAREFLTELGYNTPTYPSDAQNLVIISQTVRYRQLK